MIINKLVNLYKSKLMTQEEFAEKVGVSKTTISQIINGQTNPRVDLVERFAKELGVPVGYFFEEDNISNTNFINNKNSSYESDYKTIIDFLSQPTSSIDIGYYLQKLINDTIINSKELNYYIEKLDKANIINFISTSASAKHHIEMINNIILKNENDFANYVNELPLNNLINICKNLIVDFATYLGEMNELKDSINIKKVFLEINKTYNKIVDEDINIKLLIKYDLISMSDLSEQISTTKSYFLGKYSNIKRIKQ